MLIFYSSFLSNEQVCFFFFQMNAFLVILKFKKHQHIGKSVVFLKCLKEPKYADFWLHLQFNKGLFCHFGITEVNKKWHFFLVFTKDSKNKEKN